MTKAPTIQSSETINEALPYKVCINLDRRPDRWQQMLRKFDRHGIHSVQRFPAVDGNTLNIPANWIHTAGAYGCLLSHLQVIKDARQLGVSSVLIFEDDVVFQADFQKRFIASVMQLPSDWDMLFFGALHKDEPIKVSKNIVRITKANSTYAYALRDTVFDDFIEINSQAQEVLDINTFVLQRQRNCYCVTPHLAWVETDYSDAQQRLERHWYLQESLVLFGRAVDQLLGDTTIVFAHQDCAGPGSALANMVFLANYYHEFFSPHLAIVIVEQGPQQTIDPATLPTNCRYVFCQDEGPFNKERCLRTGIDNSDPQRKFLILSDNDIYLETLDIRANLRMCEQYDCATGFSSIIALTKEATKRVRETSITRGIDVTRDPGAISQEQPGHCYFLNRAAIASPTTGAEGRPEQASSTILLHQSERLRIFQSPNHALRLHRD